MHIRHKWLALLLAFAFLLSGCGSGQPAVDRNKETPLVIKILDVGQGDAILIRSGNEVMLVDTGDVPAKEKLVSYLKAEGIKTIDKVLITHPHADHLGGILAVLEQFSVKQIYDSGQTATTALYRNYLTQVKKKNIPFKVLANGDQIEMDGGVILRILAPEKTPIVAASGGTDLNNNSIVAKLVLGNFSMLLTGDAEQPEEAVMLKNNSSELKSQVLKVGHHGSNTSSSPAFLKAVSPEIAIVSVGANNDYHHPHPSTLKKYANAKINLFRTDLNGTVTLTSDGKTYNIKGEK